MATYRNFLILTLCCVVGTFANTGSVSADPNAMNPVILEPESALELSNRLIRETDAYLEQVGQLESLYGPYDAALLEPLGSLSSTYIERRDFESAQSAFDRRIHIIRIQEGLNTPTQIPLLEEAFANDLQLGDWEAANTRLETIFAVMDENSAQYSIEMLNQADQLKDWYLQSIILDSDDLRELQGMRIGELQQTLLDQANDLFVEDHDSLIPWLYQFAMDEYRSISVRRIRGFLGKAPQINLFSTVIRTRDQSIATSFSNLKRIRDILADAGDLEGEAMALIALADLRLKTSKGSALALYRSAMDKMEEAGISEAKIEEFFNRPTVIPTPVFHRTINSALAAQDENGFVVESRIDGEGNQEFSYDMGDYYAWHPNLPGIERPPIPSTAQNFELEQNSIRLSFALNSRGQPRNINVVELLDDHLRVGTDAIRGVQGLRFRPQFVDRRWQSIDTVEMTYHYPRL